MKNTIKLLIFMFAIPQTIFCAQGDQKKSDELAGVIARSSSGAAAPNLRPEYQAHEDTLSAEGFDLSQVVNSERLNEKLKKYTADLLEEEIKKLPSKTVENIEKIIDTKATALKSSQAHFNEYKKAFAAINNYTPAEADSNVKTIQGNFYVQIGYATKELSDKYKISQKDCSIQ